MNDKLRFIVLTLLMIVFFPWTILFVFFGWLCDGLENAVTDYIGLFRKAWRKK